MRAPCGSARQLRQLRASRQDGTAQGASSRSSARARARARGWTQLPASSFLLMRASSRLLEVGPVPPRASWPGFTPWKMEKPQCPPVTACTTGHLRTVQQRGHHPLPPPAAFLGGFLSLLLFLLLPTGRRSSTKETQDCSGLDSALKRV